MQTQVHGLIKITKYRMISTISILFRHLTSQIQKEDNAICKHSSRSDKEGRKEGRPVVACYILPQKNVEELGSFTLQGE